MSTQYPFIIPSHVSVQSFVTVKLSDKSMYDLWKTQILFLLETHDLLGFIDGSIRPSVIGHDDSINLWKRTDALVNGWLLASLSQHTAIKVLNSLKSKFPHQTYFTSKDIWDQVQSMYGQRADHKKHGEDRPITIDLEKMMREVKERSKNNQQLYLVAECGTQKDLSHILENQKVEVLTESISINGNTALHIAAANSTDGILKHMLNMLPDNYPLKELRNSDGSTLLHLAASFGNTNAAKILVTRSPDLLSEKDKQGCTPLDIVLSEPWNKEMCLFLWNSTPRDIELQDHHTSRGDEPLVNAISYGDFDLAMKLLKGYNSLKGDSVLMAIAQHCPAELRPYETIIHKLWETPVLEFIRSTLDMDYKRLENHGYLTLANFILKAGSLLVFWYPIKLLIWIGMKLPAFNKLNEKLKKIRIAKEVLDVVCGLIKLSNDESCWRDYCTEPILEAIRRDASDIVERIVYWFPCAAMILDEDGNNIAQAAWKNRALKVYALIVHGNMAKHTKLSQKIEDDPFGNNFLHFAARLAPARKLDLVSAPPLQLQRELRWFKAAQDFLPLASLEKNCFGETPEMVFTKEHKELVTESGNWMKNTANSYALSATLIITVVFAAAITVPGGNKDTNGDPNFLSHPAYIVFLTSVAISMVTCSMSLVLFLSILTARHTQQDFFMKLPLKLVVGLVGLFVSAAFTMLAFGAALFLMFGKKHLWTLGLIAPSISLTVFLFYSFYRVHLADFFTSILQFETIYHFRRLKLLGRIFI